MTRFVFSPRAKDVLERRLAPVVERREAKAIVDGTKRNANMSGYRNTVRSKVLDDGVRVGTAFPFAHLDEWGSINNWPSGAMRRAVERTGLRWARGGQ